MGANDHLLILEESKGCPSSMNVSQMLLCTKCGICGIIRLRKVRVRGVESKRQEAILRQNRQQISKHFKFEQCNQGQVWWPLLRGNFNTCAIFTAHNYDVQTKKLHLSNKMQPKNIEKSEHKTRQKKLSPNSVLDNIYFLTKKTLFRT